MLESIAAPVLDEWIAFFEEEAAMTRDAQSRVDDTSRAQAGAERVLRRHGR